MSQSYLSVERILEQKHTNKLLERKEREKKIEKKREKEERAVHRKRGAKKNEKNSLLCFCFCCLLF